MQFFIGFKIWVEIEICKYLRFNAFDCILANKSGADIDETTLAFCWFNRNLTISSIDNAKTVQTRNASLEFDGSRKESTRVVNWYRILDVLFARMDQLFDPQFTGDGQCLDYIVVV